MFLLQVYWACPRVQVRRSTMEFRSLRSARKTFLSNSYNWSYCFLFVSHPGCDNVRLVGTSRCSGRVEVFYNDKWGTVCDDHWGLSNADVVCRELKCGTALAAKGGAFFGEGKEDIWLDDVQCAGNEQSIHKCTHRPYGSNNCGHGEDAGVICSGQSEFHASLPFVKHTFWSFLFVLMVCKLIKQIKATLSSSTNATNHFSHSGQFHERG